MPNDFYAISSYAFINCIKMEHIIIPSSVSIIENYAFKNTPKLEIYCEAEAKPSGWEQDWCEETTKIYWKNSKCKNNKY